MSYTKERDEFIAIAAREGLPVDIARKLLRYATTLQRLAVAQCNGDWPYNGDRDRPSARKEPCATCSNRGQYPIGETCPDCKGERWIWKRDADADERHDRRYVVCPECEASGVAKVALRKGVCPDCRTSALVRETLQKFSVDYWKQHDLATHEMDMTPRTDYSFTPIIGGDPRGCVLKITVPSKSTNDWGREGICVPAARV